MQHVKFRDRASFQHQGQHPRRGSASLLFVRLSSALGQPTLLDLARLSPGSNCCVFSLVDDSGSGGGVFHPPLLLADARSHGCGRLLAFQNIWNLYFCLCFPLFFLSFISTVGRCFGQWGCKKISSLGTRTGGEGWPGREWYPPSCFVFI